MDGRVIFVVLALQLSMVACGARRPEPCAQPGALRCDAHFQSVCLARSRVWLRTRDCAASGGACVEGRCVAPARSKAPRAESCNYPSDQPRCTPDCRSVQICLATGVWFNIYNCTSQMSCDEPSGTCKPSGEASCKQGISCTTSGNIPVLKNSSLFYDCSSENNIGILTECAEKSYYDACSGGCNAHVDPSSRYPSGCENGNTGNSDHFFSNPALYYICIQGDPMWLECDEGYYENTAGGCVGTGSYCKKCQE